MLQAMFGSTVIEKNKKFVELLNNIAALKLGNYQDNTIDAFVMLMNI